MTGLTVLQYCLAAEHAALYSYGVLGGVLSGFSRPGEEEYAVASYAAHRARRDALTVLIDRRGAAPTTADPAYRTAFPVIDVASCRALAQRVERRTAEVYCFAVSKTTDGARRMLASAVIDAAVREVRWGGDVRAFPGAPEL